MKRIPASISEAFDEAATRYAERIALAGDAGKGYAEDLTYAQLAARADRIASWLRARGIGRGKTVGLFAQRSADTIAAILGILKAGAAYVQAVTQAYTVTEGVHTLAFVGQATNDATLFLDKISLLPAGQGSTVAIGNSGFETPNLGSNNYNAFQYNSATVPGSQDWLFQGFAGVTGNQSGFTSMNPSSPEGAQVAFLQSGGSVISQVVSLPSDGTYLLTLSAAQRGNWNEGEQMVQVYLDDNAYVGAIQPHSAVYQSFALPITTSAGQHRLSFKGTTNSDSTLFLDRVVLQVPGSF